ncbi:Acyltransferase [Paraburkholderia tropica]|nr:Acyltransferase [Paraburkholderia tropica]
MKPNLPPAAEGSNAPNASTNASPNASTSTSQNASTASAKPARTDWAQREERGSALLLRVMTWLSLRLGRPAGRALLHLCAAYYVLFSPRARGASRDYLRRALKRAPQWRDLWRHVFTFATTIHDRIYLMHGRFDLFDIRPHGQTLVDEALAGGRGAFLMGAHLGSFEVVRALGRTRPDLRVVVTMFEENARKINATLAAVNPAASPEVISLGQIDSMLKVNQRLDENCMVGMLADRTLLADDSASLRRMAFLGEPAAFPLGPLYMAAMLKRPVLFMTGLYRGGNRYDVHFEMVADFTHTPREARRAAIDAALARYVSLLDKYARAAPYNWFNYFDFWKTVKPAAAPSAPVESAAPARDAGAASAPRRNEAAARGAHATRATRAASASLTARETSDA